MTSSENTKIATISRNLRKKILALPLYDRDDVDCYHWLLQVVGKQSYSLTTWFVWPLFTKHNLSRGTTTLSVDVVYFLDFEGLHDDDFSSRPLKPLCEEDRKLRPPKGPFMKTKAAAFQDKSNFVRGGNYQKREKRTKLDFFVKTRMTCTLVWICALKLLTWMAHHV